MQIPAFRPFQPQWLAAVTVQRPPSLVQARTPGSPAEAPGTDPDAAAREARAAAETARRLAEAQRLQRELEKQTEQAKQRDDAVTKQGVDEAWKAVGRSAANELRIKLEHGADFDQAAAEVKASGKGNERFDAEFDRTRPQVQDETDLSRKTSLAAFDAETAANEMQSAKAGVDSLSDLPSGVRRAEESSVRTAYAEAQTRYEKAWTRLEDSLAKELQTLESSLRRVNVPGYDPRTAAVSAIKERHEGQRLDDLIEETSAELAIKDEMTRIDPDDATLTAQQRRIAQDDPLTFAATQVLMRDLDDPVLADALMEATVQLRTEHTKTEVARLMKGDTPDIAGAVKVLKTNMDAARSPAERERILDEAGGPFFDAGALDEQIDRLTALPGRDADMKERYDGTMHADKIGRWLSELMKDAPPELADRALQAVYDRIDPKWTQANDNALSVGMTQGVDLYKGLSRGIEMSGDPAWAERFAKKLTDGADEGTDLFRVMMRGPSAGMTSPVAVDTVRTAFERSAQEGDGAQLTDALMREFEKSDPYQVIDRVKDAAETAIKTAPGGLQFAAFERDPKAHVEATFQNFARTLGDDARRMDGAQLRNFIGGSLGMRPKDTEAAAAQDNSRDWYDGKALDIIEPIEKRLHEVGGERPEVRMAPVAHGSESTGVAPTALFKVKAVHGDDKGKELLVDDRAEKTFKDLDDWLHHNAFSDDGIVVVPKDLSLKPDRLGRIELESMAAHKTSTGQKIANVAKGVGVAAAVVGTVALTGGAATVGWSLVAGGSVLTAGGAGYNLYQMDQHGQSWTSREAFDEWVTIAGSAAGVLAGAGVLAQGAAQGSKAAAVLGSVPVSVSTAATGLGSFGYFTYQTVANWDKLSAGDKFMFMATSVAPFAVGARGARVSAGWSDWAGHRPARVGYHDSGNGGVLFEQFVSAELKAAGFNTQSIVAADRKYGPYGNKGDWIPNLTARGLQEVQNRGCKVAIGACNTASGSALNHPRMADELAIPFSNLVQGTSKFMVETSLKHGDPKPVYFATEPMVGYGYYDTLPAQLSGGKVQPHGIAAPKWAPIVDAAKHASKDPAKRAEAQAAVDEIVAKIPPGTKIAYLNCTHYSALDEMIGISAKKLFPEGDSRHNLQVINPASVQTAAVKQAVPNATAYQGRELTPIILLSGSKQQVQEGREAIKGLLGHDNFRTVRVDHFGAEFGFKNWLQSGGTPLEYFRARRDGIFDDPSWPLPPEGTTFG